jgi:hypothetical protein
MKSFHFWSIFTHTLSPSFSLFSSLLFILDMNIKNK